MAFFKCVSNATVFVDGEVFHDSLIFNSLYEETIQEIDIPYNFYNGSAVSTPDNKIHIIGSSDMDYGLYHYEWDGTAWTKHESLPYYFYNGSATVIGNSIHLFGGGISPRSHYEWNNNAWTSLDPLPYDFYDGTAVVFNSETHLLGSDGDNSTLHYYYKNNIWTELSNLPFDMINGSAFIHENNLYASNNTNIYKYDSSNDSWTNTCTAYEGTAFSYKGNIRIIGDTHYYTWDGNAWATDELIPYTYTDGSVVLYNEEIHILGSSVNECMNCHYAYKVPYYSANYR